MKTEGIWKGVRYIENIRGYIEDDKFVLEILFVDKEGNVQAVVREPGHVKGLREGDVSKEEIRNACGKLDSENGVLNISFETEYGCIGNCLSSDNCKELVEIVLNIDFPKQTMKGFYKIKTLPDLQAVIEIQKIS